MKLENGRTQAEQAEYFAKSLHKTWGVGDATCNSGLVLFISKDDRQVLQIISRLDLPFHAVKVDFSNGKRPSNPQITVYFCRCTWQLTVKC